MDPWIALELTLSSITIIFGAKLFRISSYIGILFLILSNLFMLANSVCILLGHYTMSDIWYHLTSDAAILLQLIAIYSLWKAAESDKKAHSTVT